MRRLLIAAILPLYMAMACSTSGTKLADTVETTGSIASSTLSNNRISAITQDSHGHIWIGTFRGLNKYDSHEYHQYFCSSDDNSGLPDNQIQSLLSDLSGKLWVGTVNGICRYQDDDSFKYIPVYGTNSANITQILESRSGRILINTADAISLFNPISDCFESRLTVYSNDWRHLSKAFISPDDRLWIVGDKIYCYNIDTFRLEGSFPAPEGGFVSGCMTADGDIWMNNNGKLSIFSTTQENFIPLPAALDRHSGLASTYISQVFLCSGHILLITDSGANYTFNPSSGTLAGEGDPDFIFDIPDFSLNTVYEDSDNNIWWCSYDQGYKISYAYKERFGNNILNAGLGGKSVLSLDIHDNRIFLATLRDGIYCYDSGKGTLSSLKGNYSGPGLERQYIGGIRADRHGRLWIGTMKKVLLCSVNADRLNLIHSWDCPPAICLKPDDNGNMWVGTTSGSLMRINGDTMQVDVVSLGIDSTAYTFIGGIDFLPSGNIITAAFGQGLYEVERNTLKARKIEFPQDDWARSITRSIFIPSSLKVDRRGIVWIGTVANGLLKFDPASGSLCPVPGSPCNDICSIEEDSQGNLWVSTQYGLSEYDRTVGKFINWYEADGIGGNQFYDRASGVFQNGNLIFGGTHGVTFFDPVEVMHCRNVPLMFETLKVHNEAVIPSEGGSIDKAMTFNPPVRLKYSQNSFAVSFTALDYSEYERVRYSYMLEGFDTFWIDANNNREANYANLPPGRYKFKVRVTDIGKAETLAEKSLDVTIDKPLYLSWWACLIYTALFAGLLCLIIVYRNRLLAERQAKKQAAMEREQEKKVNEMNMSFFANISHEFRTPLTMIAAPVAQLSESPSVNSEGKRLLAIVQRNIARMLRLVNQLLDFNKLENDTLKLKVRKIDVVELLNYLADIFRVSAEEKGISLVTWGIEDSLIAWVDDDKLDKICFNLLSNAMKFTGQGGKIEMSLDYITGNEAEAVSGIKGFANEAKYLKIVVKDTGPGIPEEQMEKIFERYYQLDDNVRGAYNWGTGIGLYYARTLAKMHHGWLKASNRTDMQGAMFTLLIPAGESSYSESEKAKDTSDSFVTKKVVRIDSTPEPDNTDERRNTVLIVDDDTDVVRYMKELLSTKYNVICKYDADSAFLSVKQDSPDIVISDVRMPGKSGYVLCKDIKSSLQLSHIPVILLTAKANVDEQVMGLDSGADAYVTKPFEPQYLLALVHSQIRNREKIRAMLSQATEVSSLDENVLSEQDNSFMKELYALMEAELSNDELDVTGMTERLHISRTKFYYKVKGLTGENPSVFFKRYKLNRAAQLIKEHKYNISEIADMTGFSTLSHFSTSFKKQFGTSPSEYAK
ncbi:MAG: two-component regulator propeller domain-containing protein [Candidatus Cryptobacteroides sp.]